VTMPISRSGSRRPGEAFLGLVTGAHPQFLVFVI